MVITGSRGMAIFSTKRLTVTRIRNLQVPKDFLAAVGFESAELAESVGPGESTGLRWRILCNGEQSLGRRRALRN